MTGFSVTRTAAERLAMLTKIGIDLQSFLDEMPQGQGDEIWNSLMTSRHYLLKAIFIATEVPSAS